jgi:diguanylate cyclase (GGDEF)-like protein/PAS domain S-box-containing protein
LDYKDLEYRFSNLPVIFVLMLDLNPDISTDGGVFLRQDAKKLVISYFRLKAFNHPENVYTSQVVLHSDDSFDISYNGLPLGQQYYVNDRANAAIWAIGAKPAQTIPQITNFSSLPKSSGEDGTIQDEYLFFRKYLHNFLLPLALAVLAGNLLFLVGLPLVMNYGLTRPLNSLLEGVKLLNQGQLALQIPVQYNDEIGFLTRSFNNLSNELENLIKTLESRVAERTADLQTANDQLRKLSIAIEQSPSAIFITDLNARIEYVNPAFTHSTGYTFAEVCGQDPRILKSNLTSPETFQEMWETLLAGKTWRGELSNRKKNGDVYWEYIVIAPIHDEKNILTHYVSIQEDITNRKLAEQSLQESEKRYRDLFEMESDAIFIIRNADGAILEANSAATVLYGFSHTELINKRNTDLSAEPEATQKATNSPAPIDQIISIPLRWHRKKDGAVFPVEITARFITWKGESVHIAAIRDITEHQHIEKELERLAITDSLTGLFNRRHFFVEAEKIFARSKYPPFELVILMMDIDHFKIVNDTYGHQQGDTVLREIARCIQENLRPTDLLGRYGGEEFVALLPRTPGSDIGPVADRLLKSIRDISIDNNGVSISVTISLGVALLTNEIASLDELLSHADKALYAAKQLGRNRWAVWEENQL